MAPIQIILSIVIVKDLHLEQLDLKTPFLHGNLKEEIYIQQSKGFEIKGNKNMVCKSLCDASRQWHFNFDSFMLVT